MRNKDSQAAAVGAMITFMILLLVLSIITLYYIPVWLKDKEAQRMREVERGFMELSSRVTSLILNNDKTTTPKIAIQLGVEGIPLLAPGSLGTLTLEPCGASIHVYNETELLSYRAFGAVKFTSQNRYYPRQNYVYELGALFIEQAEGSIIKSPPQINLTAGKLTITLISINGVNQSISGWGSEAISLRLQYCESITHLWGSENITVNITSSNAEAWEKIFENYSTGSSTLGSNYFTVALSNIRKLELKFAAIELTLVPP